MFSAQVTKGKTSVVTDEENRTCAEKEIQTLLSIAGGGADVLVTADQLKKWDFEIFDLAEKAPTTILSQVSIF